MKSGWVVKQHVCKPPLVAHIYYAKPGAIWRCGGCHREWVVVRPRRSGDGHNVRVGYRLLDPPVTEIVSEDMPVWTPPEESPFGAPRSPRSGGRR